MKVEINGTVNFECAKADLRYVAKIVSKRLTGQEDQLKGFENYIRDEVPTVYSDDFLGLRIILMQNPEEENQFQIEISDRMDILSKIKLSQLPFIDVSDRLYALLKDCPELIFSENYQ